MREGPSVAGCRGRVPPYCRRCFLSPVLFSVEAFVRFFLSEEREVISGGFGCCRLVGGSSRCSLGSSLAVAQAGNLACPGAASAELYTYLLRDWLAFSAQGKDPTLKANRKEQVRIVYYSMSV